MRLPHSFIGLINLGLRGSTLALRFCLSFYVIKLIGIEASGIYGLLLGLVGIVPAAVGWGLNYFVSREVVGTSDQVGMLFIRDRLVVTLASLSAVTLIALAVLVGFGWKITLLYWLIIVLVWMETIALDLYLPLLGMELAFKANIFVFVRSALWVVPLVGLGLYLPAMRTMEAVLTAWVAGNLVGFLLLVYFVRHWPLGKILSTPVDAKWLKLRLSQSWFIYLSDLGLVGLIYMDRYIAGSMLGLALTGVYTFYWSLANALQTLVQTAVVQVALPSMVKAFQNDDIDTWRQVLRKEFVKTLVISAALSLAIYLASQALMVVLHMDDVRQHYGLFLLLLVAAVVRSCSDLINMGLTSMRRDGHYAIINIAGVFFSGATAVACIWLFDLSGAGIAALIAAAALLGVRVYYLNKPHKAAA